MLALVETDKATMDMEANRDGFFAKALVKEGTAEIAIGQVSYKPLLQCVLI